MSPVITALVNIQSRRYKIAVVIKRDPSTISKTCILAYPDYGVEGCICSAMVQ